ncbi:MAG: DNA repair protein RecN [Bacteroidia bacterium]|nr:DNA repair protein RecN [Bacteroidia bacterium]
MLLRLFIKNYALINQLDISFEPTFVIITGETGAGKSILLGALNLILGSRSDTTMLLDQKQKCIVEAEFDISAYNLQWLFTQFELDYQPHTIIRREINAEGKSRAFINDTPINLTVLRDLAIQLVDIHSQRDSLALNDANYQMQVIDAFAKNRDLLLQYSQLHKTYNKAVTNLHALIEQDKTAKANFDFIQFQWQELQVLQLHADEQETLEHELEKLEHADAIMQHLSMALNILQQDEGSLSQLRQCSTELKPVARYHANYQALADRVESLRIELSDVGSELQNELDKIQINPQRIEIINDRLGAIYKLQKKHDVKTVAELLQLQARFDTAIQNAAAFDELIAEQQKKVGAIRVQLTENAQNLNANRKHVLQKFESEIKHTLAELSMPDAQLKINLKTSDTFYANGTDLIEFTFSANAGHDFKPISKVASGGELSRFMLALKSLTARVMHLPTLIFDEIDTGVSGQVALQMGSVMQKIAATHQVISITHLPQIAAKGRQHLNVFKISNNTKTLSGIKTLNEAERVTEIAKMIGGNNYSATAETQARELMLLN